MKKILLYFFVSSALIFTSCINAISDNDNSSNSASVKNLNCAKISGSVSAEGAFPQEVAACLNASSYTTEARTAFPGFTNADLIYSIEAVNVADSTDKHAALIADDKKSYTITIPSEQTKTYKIKASVKLSATGPDILSDESDEFEISPENMIVAMNISLKFANSSTAKGNISLKVKDSSSSTIKSAEMKYGTPTMQGTKSGSEFTFSKTNLSPGVYQVTFNFYSKTSQQGELLYSFEETVNVYGNMTTNTWFQHGKSPWLKTTNSITTCEITKDMIDGFKQAKIYVDTTASSSTETGTALNPCKTFSAALAKLTDSTRDYTILIRGTVSDPQEISSTLNAKSITIGGASGLNSRGEPQDSFDGNEKGTALKISTQVPVILQNIEIKNGKTTSRGNGIYNEGKLTIESGTFIRNNKSTGTGGGIYNKGELYMNGGIISDNNAVMGGGIYNADVGKLEIKGGEISGNNSSDGAGLYLTNNSGKTGYTQISGGKISGNSVESKGAAIYVDTGSVLKMKGDFYIPYDNEKKNDVYVASTSLIKISGKLTPPTECSDEIMATLTLKSDLYSSTSAVISLDTSPSPATTIAEEYYKFKISAYNSSNYGLSSEAMPKTIIGTKSKPCAVGDIVFNDGSASSKNETITDTQKSKSIAVIFYKGTGLNNGNDTTTVRTLGYGVIFEGNSGNGYMWCSESAAGYRKTISAIQWDPNHSLKSHNNYDDYNGSDNFAELAKVVTDTGTAGNYPIFEFANNYKSKLGSRLNGGISDYETGWFVPTVGELYQLLINTSNIYSSISKCGGNAPITNNGVQYWTSNSYSTNSTGLEYTSSRGYDPFHNGRSAGVSQYFESKYFVCAIHEF